MSIYQSNWSPRGVRKSWDKCSVGNDDANSILGEYINGNVIDACAWFDERDGLRILVADTDAGRRVTYRSNAGGFTVSSEPAMTDLIAALEGLTGPSREVEGFCLKPFTVTVSGFPAAFYAARTRQQATARCWRDYQSYQNIAFKDFLKIARVSKAEAPDGFGEPITVGGEPAFRVSGEPGVNNYVKFVRPGSDRIVYSHPNDVALLRAKEAKDDAR